MVGAAHAPIVAVLTRAPSSGGKSRLFSALGCPPDPALLTALLLDTLEAVSIPGVRTVVAVTPSTAIQEIQVLAPGVEVIAQPDGDLGARMGATLERLLVHEGPAVALIGSDVPLITGEIIKGAFEVITRDSRALVLGPAADGGYFLIAAARAPRIFAGIEWGSARVLEQTRAAARSDGFRVYELEQLEDVDTVDALRSAALSGRARRTAAWYVASGFSLPLLHRR